MNKKLQFRLPSISVIVLIIFLIWILTGIYIVAPEEQGVVLRFGKFVRIEKPGPHYHLPYPIEKVYTPKVMEVKRIEVGFRTVSLGPPARYQKVETEALMLTGDENIVDAEFVVQYKIKDAYNYLFKVKDIEKTIRSAAESALREIMGKTSIDEALTTGKFRIQQETKLLLQKILDKYQAGIKIVAVQLQDVHPPAAVIDAFKDVASAREDKNKFINEAKGYANDILPRARGEAEAIIKEAIAYKEKRIKEAQGEVEKFKKLLAEYRKARSITKKRIYLETMEEILPNIKKYIIQSDKVYPFLDLKFKKEEKKEK